MYKKMYNNTAMFDIQTLGMNPTKRMDWTKKPVLCKITDNYN